MDYIFTENFLLQSETAQRLYHDYAENLPIIDYHNHLPAQTIAENKNFENITKVWLNGDHYKWRAMRAFGIDEKYITGNANDREKFNEWAKVVPHTLRNPLFHWTHLELKDPFGIRKYLNPETADQIYDETQRLLQHDDFKPVSLIHHFKVEMVGTTDDPTDSLAFHQQIKTQKNKFNVRPNFRPDKVFQLANGDAFRKYIQKLSAVSGIEIKDIDSLLDALKKRIDWFDEMGCVTADHGLTKVPRAGNLIPSKINAVFKMVLDGDDSKAKACEEPYAFYMLQNLCAMYFEKRWVQQFHLGALRNTNKTKLRRLGADTGYDSIGDGNHGIALAELLDGLEAKNKLTKTIIYNVNPADNAVFATMAGNFQGDGVRGKIQYGAAWWFMDQLDGMTDQINTLSNTGLLSTFIGMLTDSRSFLSFPRHEYFRRLLCNLFANDIQNGLLPNDLHWVGRMIGDICYNNAKDYFKAV